MRQIERFPLALLGADNEQVVGFTSELDRTTLFVVQLCQINMWGNGPFSTEVIR